MAVTTLGNIAVGSPLTLTDGRSYTISDTDAYLSAVTVNSIDDVDFTMANTTNITGVDFSHTHNDIYYTETELLTDGVLDDRYYTETDLLTTGVLDSRYYEQSVLDDGELDSMYYTKTELAASNASSVHVHWDNLNSVPSMEDGTEAMKVIKVAIDYEYLCADPSDSDELSDNGLLIATLPIGTVIWDVKVKITTEWNNAEDDWLSIGPPVPDSGSNPTLNYKKYLDEFSVDDTVVGWTAIVPHDCPKELTAQESVYAYYTSTDTSTTAGAADVYIYYSSH